MFLRHIVRQIPDQLIHCPHMAELESLLEKARQLAEGRNHKLLPFIRGLNPAAADVLRALAKSM